MGSSFGGSIKLSGESEYKKALKEIDSSLRVLGSEMKEVTSQFDKNDRSAEKQKSKHCEKPFRRQRRKQAKIQKKQSGIRFSLITRKRN